MATPCCPRAFSTRTSPAYWTVEEVAAADEEPAAAAAAAADSSAVEAEARRRARWCAGWWRQDGKLPRFRLRLQPGDWAEVVRKPRHQKQFGVSLGSHVAHLLIDSRLNGLLAPRRDARRDGQVHRGGAQDAARAVLGGAVELGALLGWSRHAETTAASNLEMGRRTRRSCASSTTRRARRAGRTSSSSRRARAPRRAARAPLTDASAEGADTADGETAVDVNEAAAGGGGGAAGVAGMLGKLAVQEEAAADAQPEEAARRRAAGPRAAGQADGKNDKVCVITGLAAKYKDPQTGLPYANLDVQGCGSSTPRLPRRRAQRGRGAGRRRRRRRRGRD